MKNYFKMLFVFKHQSYAIETIDELKKCEPKINQIQLLAINAKSIKYLKNSDFENRTSQVKKFLKEENNIGFFIINTNKVVAYAWAKICIGKKSRIMGYFDISPNESFIYYCRVTEEFKGNNLYPFLLFELSKTLFNKYNVNTVLIDTEVKNTASQRGIEKVGFKFLTKNIYLLFRGHLLFKKESFRKNRKSNH